MGGFQAPDNGGFFSLDARGDAQLNMDYSFPTDPGSLPQRSTKLVEYEGWLYGVTSSGGSSSAGLIFRYGPSSGQYEVMHVFNFTDGNGYSPYGGLLVYNGTLYGTTRSGGANSVGVLFKYTLASGTYTKLWDFGASGDGQYPDGGLTVYNNILYGMTRNGGSRGYGTIFKLDPATDAYTKLWDFNFNTDGANPEGRLAVYDDALYGVTNSGGGSVYRGTVFKYVPASNTYTVLYHFLSASGDGYNPTGNLVLDGGSLYGTTQYGGSNSAGAVFRLDVAGNTMTWIANMGGLNGASATGELTVYDGYLYGVASSGGSSANGTIFRISLSDNSLTKLVDFTGYNGDGRGPVGGLAVYNNVLYGLTKEGGSNNGGIIYKYDPATASYAKLMEFNGANRGKSPTGGLVEYKGDIYGVANMGGLYNSGVMYKYKPATQTFTKLHDFDITNGSYPSASPVVHNGVLYGTANGGSYNYGVVFKYDLSAGVYTKLVDITGTAGVSPTGELTPTDSYLYGVMYSGGANSLGVIYRVSLSDNTYSKQYDFTAAGGGNPAPGALLLYNDDLYGMTTTGGVNNKGTLYRFRPSNGSFTKLYDFDGTNGGNPMGGLVLVNGFLYGVTRTGGANNLGTVFKWDLSGGTYTKLYDFDGTNGSSPNSTLLSLGGQLYGIAMSGGANNYGVVFRVTPADDSFAKLADFGNETGTYPTRLLCAVPIPVAAGIPGACDPAPSVTISAANANEWVPLTDAGGNAIAEINANGNILGNVDVSLYVHNGEVRGDASNHLYLDRNITLTPQFQPTTPVDLRLYIRHSEYNALAAAHNQQGTLPAIGEVSDLSILKSENACDQPLEVALPIDGTVAEWGEDHVFSTSISGFSSFYFASNVITVLPLRLLDFRAAWKGPDVVINWRTAEEFNVSHFEVERSYDGISYTPIQKIPAGNMRGERSYGYTDPRVSALPYEMFYYRLKMTDRNGDVEYSGIERLSANGSSGMLRLSPNPTANTLYVQVPARGRYQWVIRDNTGRGLMQGYLTAEKTGELDVRSLNPGVYYLQLSNERKTGTGRFVKVP